MNHRPRTILAALCTAFALTGLFAMRAGFSVAWLPLARQAAVVLVLGVTWLCYSRLKRPPAITLALETSLFAIALSSLFNFPMFLLARLGGTPGDALFAAWDHALGLNVPALVRFTRSHPFFELTFECVYQSLRVVSVAAVLLPALLGRVAWVSELLLALALSAGFSLLILAKFQAVGPWSGGAFSPTPGQAECSAVLSEVARGARVTIDVSRSAPIIALPSWHVILATLSARSLGRVRGMRAASALWAALVALSTLATGWHYGADVIAGFLVAAAALGLSQALHRHWLRRDRVALVARVRARVAHALSERGVVP